MQRYAGKVVSKLFFFQFFLLFLSEFIYFWYYSEARLHVLASIHEHNENIFIIIYIINRFIKAYKKFGSPLER